MNGFSTGRTQQSPETTTDLFEWLRLSGHVYSILQSEGVMGGKMIAFSHKDCKYYVAARKEISSEKMAEILPYLRWKFDEIKPEIELVEVEEEAKTKAGNTTMKKVKKEVYTGNSINSFPATTENIIKKKKDLLSEAFDTSDTQEQLKIKLLAIVPRLDDHEVIKRAVGNQSEDKLQRVANMLKRTSGR